MKILCQREVHTKSGVVCCLRGGGMTVSDTFFCTFVADLGWSAGRKP
ncbi:hypothetical protein PORUE0001_0966 [Porphyromonas uenonis 60-3]|uniref:Uncharacterized protein n=1 Tax=Porphyromonas uenonis 60-3 TaxID=596327 RepID=C2MAV5_9PORP|nr:hypothetical protein PORUE0001_0966 [Porphyromonas uenonis 60-3]